MKITLIGFMGCGKTTIAKALAQKLNYGFIDLDKIIETVAGISVTEIFNTKGEEYFRELEREALKILSDNGDYVVAVGGGTPCFYNNMEEINKHSVSVYLKMSTDSLFDRLKNEQAQRPLIKNLNEKELKLFIADNLLKREPFYLKAHYKVKAKDMHLEALVDFIKTECLSELSTHSK